MHPDELKEWGERVQLLYEQERHEEFDDHIRSRPLGRSDDYRLRNTNTLSREAPPVELK